jgi:hypothetical protein
MTTSVGGLCPKCLLQDTWNDLTGVDEESESDFATDYLQSLFPTLIIERLITRGGMGSTYLVLQKGLNRRACLKVLSPSLATNPEFVARFRQEAEVIGQLNDPGIVTVFDASQVENVLYILMEFVDGTNLKEFAQTTKLAPQAILEMLCQVTSGLAVAHQNNITHRDIKPANILLQRDTNQAKLSDFGLAKLEEESIYSGLTTVGQTLGTPRYMAPEQWGDAKTADARSDVYAVGVVFYELATGKLPSGHFRLPSALTKGAFTAAFDQVICKALATSPDDRYQSAEEMYLAAVQLGDEQWWTGKRMAMAGAALALLAAYGAWVGAFFNNTVQAPLGGSPLPLLSAAGSTMTINPEWRELTVSRAEFFKGVKSQGSLGRSLAITAEYIIAGAPEGGPKHIDITGPGYVMAQKTRNNPKTEPMEFARSKSIVIAGDWNEGDLAGFEVAASSVGNRPYVLIGSPGHAEEDEGKQMNHGEASVYFLGTDDRWRPDTEFTSDRETIEPPLLGFSVAAYDRFAAVGAPGFKASSDSPSGAVAIYELGENGKWNEHWIPKPKTSDMQLTLGKQPWDFGFTMAIDERFLMVGSPLDSQNQADEGAVFVYVLDTDGSWKLKQTLKDPKAAASEQFGYRLALHDEWLVVTSYSTRSGERTHPTGHVNVFRHTGASGNANADGPWQFHQRLEENSEDLRNGLKLERFGYGLDVSSDYIAVGAPTTSRSGIAHHGVVFLYALNRASNKWEPRTQILPRTGATRFGVSVKFGQDFLAIGSIFFPPTEIDNKAGAVFCFDLKNFETK